MNRSRSAEVIGAFQHALKYYDKTGNLGKNLTINKIKYKNV